jgi:peptidoglycan/LPS O-acetylase OafA/YrhL
LATLFLAVLTFGSADFLTLLKVTRYAAAQISNILFSQGQGYFDTSHDHSPLLHTWSLGVEEQFYLVWPFLLFGLVKLKSRLAQVTSLILLCLASLVLSQWMTHANGQWAFYMMPSRLWELGLGGLLSFSVLPKLKSPLWGDSLATFGLVTLGACTFLIDGSLPFPGLNALPIAVGSALLIYGTSQSQWVRPLLSCRPIVFVGKISYSLYLWHWPLIVFTTTYQQSELSIQQGILIACLSLFISYLSWRFC